MVFEPRVFEDERGLFFESYNRGTFAQAGIEMTVVQENHSLSRAKGTVRGLHFQRDPSAQAKLVRVVAGAVFDVAVDIRKGSPTFGRSVAVELSVVNRRQLFVPEGFAHGYVTLTDNAEVLYLVNRPYDKAAEGGLLWNDPALGITWPQAATDPVVNARDATWPGLAGLGDVFVYKAGQ